MSYEFYCKEAGAATCRGHITASTEEELKAKLADHVRKRHGVTEPNQTLLDHLLAVTRGRTDSAGGGR